MRPEGVSSVIGDRYAWITYRHEPTNHGLYPHQFSNFRKDGSPQLSSLLLLLS